MSSSAEPGRQEENNRREKDESLETDWEPIENMDLASVLKPV
jgi:hypothetical protein